MYYGQNFLTKTGKKNMKFFNENISKNNYNCFNYFYLTLTGLFLIWLLTLIAALLIRWLVCHLKWKQWNKIIIYNNVMPKQEYTYIVQMMYLHRKTTINLNDKDQMIIIILFTDIGSLTINVPGRFFKSNPYNEQIDQHTIIRFLYIW